MSKIIKESGYRELSHIVKSNNKYYLVDSNDTIDAGYETMVFPYNIKDNEVEDWRDLYCERYNTENEMKKHHFEVCENIEKYLKENKTIEDYGGVDPYWFLKMYAITGYLYKNEKILLRGMKEDLENFVEELKYLNKNYIDRREFKIISPSGDIIKEWWRK